uniref:Uncharacterized protein n=1 Tax=Anguilla anguilla TaxID=7936 RepID=A0A0E9VXX5_ANGAN
MTTYFYGTGGTARATTFGQSRRSIRKETPERREER